MLTTWQPIVSHFFSQNMRENKLIFRDDYKPKKGVNNYGMKLKKIET